MAQVDVCNKDGQKVGELELSDGVFAVPVTTGVLHEVVVAQLAKRRGGNACVKNRSDINASGAKMFRQKGTGRARRGDRRSPLLKGGGVVFGPHPRSYEQKTPKKVRKKALLMALSVKLAEGELKVVDSLAMENIRTKDAAAMLQTLGVDKGLLVTAAKQSNLELSTRNLPRIKVMRSEGLNVYDILKYDHLVMEKEAVEAVMGRLS